MTSKKKKPSAMDQWFGAGVSRDDVSKRTLRAAKGYLAHKTETLSSQFSHPELMEEAELRAEQISNIQKIKNTTDNDEESEDE